MSGKPSDTSLLLSEQYPVHSSWELTLSPTGIIRGRVYTTDHASGSIVLLADPHAKPTASKKQQQSQQQDPPVIHIIQAKHVVQAKSRGSAASSSSTTTTAAAVHTPDMPALPTRISRKALEEREKKAIRLAEEHLRHVNDKASPAGQACFDRLLKACKDVEWGENCSILVLDEIRVDPPYAAASCQIVKATSGQAAASLERVQKIVSAATATSSTTTKGKAGFSSSKK